MLGSKKKINIHISNKRLNQKHRRITTSFTFLAVIEYLKEVTKNMELDVRFVKRFSNLKRMSRDILQLFMLERIE